MPILNASVAQILDNFADAIEGGNSYRGSGTAYKGIPCSMEFYSSDFVDVDSENGAVSYIKIPFSEISNTQADALVAKSTGDGPPLFFICTTAGNNLEGVARKITSWSIDDFDPSARWAVSPDLPEAGVTSDRWSVVEGFKRVPDITDIEGDEGIPGLFNRSFSLRIIPGKRLPIYGNGYEWHESTMELSIRFLKKARERTTRESVLENVQRMRTILTRLEHRGNLVQLVDVLESEPEISVDDRDKVVVIDKYRIKYRVDSSFK